MVEYPFVNNTGLYKNLIYLAVIVYIKGNRSVIALRNCMILIYKCNVCLLLCSGSLKKGICSILPPYDGKAFSSFVETIYNMHGYIEHCREEYVLISQGNVITNIDYTDVFDFHSKKKADITLIYKNHAIPQGYDRPITLDVDNDGKVNQIFVKPGVVDKGVFNHAYGSILIKKDLLMSEIRNAISVNQLDVRRLIQSSLGKYSIYAYENKGYCAAISSINDYFEFNMDLMKKEVRDELFNPLLAKQDILRKTQKEYCRISSCRCTKVFISRSEPFSFSCCTYKNSRL